MTHRPVFLSEFLRLVAVVFVLLPHIGASAERLLLALAIVRMGKALIYELLPDVDPRLSLVIKHLDPDEAPPAGNEEHWRLDGFDAPEIAHHHCDTELDLGIKALEELHRLIVHTYPPSSGGRGLI